MTADDKVMARLRKLLELARRGVGGEADTADRFLQRTLAKYGLTMSDIEDQAALRSWQRFPYKTEQESKLLVNIVAMVTNEPMVSASTMGRQRAIFFRLTKYEHAEVSMHFDVLRRELAKHMDRAFFAFICANGIGSDKKSETKPEKPMDRAELELLLQMVAGTKKVPLHKALTAEAQP